MKKIIVGLVLAVVSALLPMGAFAAGGVSVSTAALTVEVGEAGTFTIVATNTIGDVMITSSDAGVARVSVGEWGTGMVEEGQTKTGAITVTGVSEGTAMITLVLDAATFDGEDLAGQTRTVTVNVVRKPEAPAVVEDNSSTHDAGAENNIVVNNVASDAGDSRGGEQASSEEGGADEGDKTEDKSVAKESSVAKQSSNQGSKSRSSDKESESSKSSSGVWWIVAVAAVGVVALGAVVWIFVKKKGRR